MAKFINLKTFQIIRGHTPDYISNPDYANLNHLDFPKITLPDCNKKYWKLNAGKDKVLKMSKAERDEIDKKELTEKLISARVTELENTKLTELQEQAISELKSEGKLDSEGLAVGGIE